MRQQVQPAAIMPAMQSQQHWIIFMQFASPEVQVTVQPSLVISHLHMPMVRLQQQTIMPFIMQQQEQVPPWSIMHKFCIMLQAIGSSQEQTTFMPPAHFSNFMVQRGTMIMPGAAGAAVPIGLPVIMPGMPTLVRSIIIVLVIVSLPRITGFLAESSPRRPGRHSHSRNDSSPTGLLADDGCA